MLQCLQLCFQTCNIFVKIQIQSKLLTFCSLFEIIFWSEFLGTYISGRTCGGWGERGALEAVLWLSYQWRGNMAWSASFTIHQWDFYRYPTSPFLPLCVGKPLYTNGSIIQCVREVWFCLHIFCLSPSCSAAWSWYHLKALKLDYILCINYRCAIELVSGNY